MISHMMTQQILATKSRVPQKTLPAAVCRWKQRYESSRNWALRCEWNVARWYACMRVHGAFVISRAKRISSFMFVIFMVRLKLSRVRFVAINIRTVTVCVYTPTSITTLNGINMENR